jgi:cellulose synthase operon protein C
MLKKSLFTAVLSLIFIFISIFPVLANDVNRTTRWLDAPGSDEYPDAGAVVLFDEIAYTVKADGSTILSEHEVIKILNKEGYERFSKLYRGFIKDRQTMTAEIARIIKPDGTIINLDMEKDVTTQARFAEQAPLYSDILVMIADFTEIEPDDIIEFKFVTYDKKPVPGNLYWAISFTRDEIPMEETRFVITMEKDADKLRWLTLGENTTIQPVKEKIGNAMRYSWILKNRPPVNNEPEAPPFRERTTYILVSTCQSWDNLASAYHRVFEPSLKPDRAVNKKVRELLAGIKDDDAKVSRLLSFVREKKILGVDFSPDYVIVKKPGELLESEILTKPDLELLFAVMLRAAGFEAYPVLAADRNFGKVDSQLPTPYQFNKLITTAKVNNKWQYFDSSFTFSQMSDYQIGTEGLYVLALKPQDSKLAKLPESTADANHEKIKADAVLSSDGSIGVTLQLIETGTRKQYWDAFFGLLKSEQAQQLVMGKLSSIISESAQLLGSEIYPGEKDGDKLQMNITFMVENYPVVSGDFWIVKLPLIPVQKSNLLNQNPSEREFPVVLSSAAKESRILNLAIPEGFTVMSLPSRLDYKNRVGSLWVTAQQEGNVIKYNSVFRIDKTVVPVAEFEDVQELFRKTQKADSEVILLKKVK